MPTGLLLFFFLASLQSVKASYIYIFPNIPILQLLIHFFSRYDPAYTFYFNLSTTCPRWERVFVGPSWNLPSEVPVSFQHIYLFSSLFLIKFMAYFYQFLHGFERSWNYVYWVKTIFYVKFGWFYFFMVKVLNLTLKKSFEILYSCLKVIDWLIVVVVFNVWSQADHRKKIPITCQS